MLTAEQRHTAADPWSNADTQAVECAFPTPKDEVPVRNTPTADGNYTTPQASSQQLACYHPPNTPLDLHALAPT